MISGDRVANRYLIQQYYAVIKKTRIVARAYDSRLDRLVVLKGDPVEDSESILTEGRILAQIRSKYVVTCYDLFSAEGYLFLANEYYSDDSLAGLMDRHKRLGTAGILPIASNLLEALDDINAAGYLYRDVAWKHMICRDQYHIRLFDLGLAVPCRRGKAARNPHCDGTWETMSPEEFIIGSQLDAAANVYSAACLIYSLFAGHYPLEYRLLIPDWEIRFEHNSELEKYAQHNLHVTHPVDPSPIPEILWPVLRKALEKNADQRYQSARDFAQDLRRTARRSCL